MSISFSSTATTPTPLIPVPLHSQTNCLSRTSSAQSEAGLSRSSPLMSSHGYPPSTLTLNTKPYQRGLLSTGARASDLNPVMQEPYMSAATFQGASHDGRLEYG